MSQVYSTEPATTGRVVVDTTHGPLDVELWCKECPSTTRTFLQLCLDGYYDGMAFHRVLPDFLVQTGLTRDDRLAGAHGAAELDGYLRRSTAVPPQRSSSGGTSGGDPLGWDRKRLEVNPRIRFNHRGQVAMAFPLEGGGGGGDGNGNDDEEEIAMLRYQFFITLDEAPFLDAKHVAFGTIAGATMFNALRIGRTDADEQTGVPTDMKDCPPRIKGIRVDRHPFEDLVVTADGSVPWKKGATTVAGAGGGGKDGRMERRRKKRRGRRDLNVLSFGDEERDFEEATGGGGSDKGVANSSNRDVLASNGKIVPAKVDADVDKRSKQESKANEPERKMKIVIDETIQKESPKMAHSSNDNGNICEAKESSNKAHAAHENNGMVTRKSRDNAESDWSHKSEKPAKSRAVGAVEARRAKYLKSGKGSSANKRERLKREGDTMERLLAFKTKVIETRGSRAVDEGAGTGDRRADDSLASRMAKRARHAEEEEIRRDREAHAFAAMPGYSGQADDDDRGDNDARDWLGTRFKCRRHMDHDSRRRALDGMGEEGGDGRRMDDYLVLDEKRSGRNRRIGRGEHGGRDRRNGSGKSEGSLKNSRHCQPRY